MYTGTYNRLNVHVMDSDTKVIRACRTIISADGLATEKRDARKQFYREILAIHHRARDMYISVMSGDFMTAPEAG